MSEAGDQEHDDANRKITRANYRKLLDKISTHQDDLTGENALDNSDPALLSFATFTDDLYNDVNDPQEASMDAAVMKHLSKLCKNQAENMTTNITQFRAEEYAERFKVRMGGGDNSGLTRRKWIKFGQQVKSMFRRTPALTYMFGALDTVEPEPRLRKPRETKTRQATKTSELKETQAVVGSESEQNVNQTDVIVLHVMKQLVRRFKANNRQPINYFKFVIDPKSFGKSVENMFHVSFLIKEGKVGLSVCEETGDPIIKPISPRQLEESQLEQDTRNQVVLSFNKIEWKKLVVKHNITFSMIESIQQ